MNKYVASNKMKTTPNDFWQLYRQNKAKYV